jgi:hypothetical protein
VEAIHHLKAPIDDLCDIAASDSGTTTSSDESTPWTVIN